MKESLGFTEGMVLGMGRDHGDKKDYKVFDWAKAAKLITEHCMIGSYFDTKKIVEAGLMEDWSCTSGPVFSKGNIVEEEDTYTYLSSSWATPILDIDGEEHECWVYATETEHDEDSYWPEDARKEIEKATK